MHIKKISIWLGVVALAVSSCADSDSGPILTFDKAGKGAYVRLIEESDKLINLFDIDGSVYTYSVEFVDLNQGDLVTSYTLLMDYEDADPSDGDQSVEDIEFRVFDAGEFADLASGFKGLEDVVITADQAITAAGLQRDDVNPGVQFAFRGILELEDGSRFSAANSTPPVRGAAFQGHFDFSLPAGCPSSLEGTYTVETTNIWCGGTASGTVDIIAVGGGVYDFSDWSFGSYGVCYGGGNATGGDLAFADVCAEVSFTGFTDSFGDTWDFSGTSMSADKTEWTIVWVNTYGESATSVLTNPDGWPFDYAP